MLLLGDVHEDRDSLLPYFRTEEEKIVQIGDLGFNYDFIKFPKPMFFIHGNHDHFEQFDVNSDKPTLVRENLTWLPWGWFENGTLYIGGADSIDRNKRRQGWDWWPEERITYLQVHELLERKLDVVRVIAHTSPAEVAETMLRRKAQKSGLSQLTRTVSPSENLLQVVFDELKPKEWYFGHWHVSHEFWHRQCKFRCLDIGEGLVIPD